MREGKLMGKENPFNHKDMEKVLFATFKRHLPQGRRTRSFLRKQARNIEHGYEIGRRDALAGKPLVSLEALQKPDDSPLQRDMVRRAYAAYLAGYLSKSEAV